MTIYRNDRGYVPPDPPKMSKYVNLQLPNRKYALWGGRQTLADFCSAPHFIGFFSFFCFSFWVCESILPWWLFLNNAHILFLFWQVSESNSSDYKLPPGFLYKVNRHSNGGKCDFLHWLKRPAPGQSHPRICCHWWGWTGAECWRHCARFGLWQPRWAS